MNLGFMLIVQNSTFTLSAAKAWEADSAIAQRLAANSFSSFIFRSLAELNRNMEILEITARRPGAGIRRQYRLPRRSVEDYLYTESAERFNISMLQHGKKIRSKLHRGTMQY